MCRRRTSRPKRRGRSTSVGCPVNASGARAETEGALDLASFDAGSRGCMGPWCQCRQRWPRNLRCWVWWGTGLASGGQGCGPLADDYTPSRRMDRPAFNAQRNVWLAGARLRRLACALWLVLVALLGSTPAAAAVPICSELAMTDFAPAPMVAARTAELRIDRPCVFRFGPRFEAADPQGDPTSPPLIGPPERACPDAFAWPIRASAVLLPTLPIWGPIAVGVRSQVFRPPRDASLRPRAIARIAR